jgi:hypothetical protein
MISDLIIGLVLVAICFVTIIATAVLIGKLAAFFSKRKP